MARSVVAQEEAHSLGKSDIFERITDFLIHEQEIAASYESEDLTVPSKIIFYGVDEHTTRCIMKSLATKGSVPAMELKSRSEELQLQ